LRRLWAGTPPRDSGVLGQGRWGAFCGIGNPEGFLRTLEQCACRPAFLTVFADHEQYTARQIEGVLRQAASAGCVGVVTTEKDSVKVERLLADPPGMAVHALQVECGFGKGSTELTARILEAAGAAR
jgi:tetraacyldisaccharide-1-P 4'-kinase